MSNENEVRVLSTGVKARLRPVAAFLLDEVMRSVPEPKVPVEMNPDKDREEPNPNSPAYMAALQAAQIERASAVNDALLMLGVELADGVPPDAEWLPGLQHLIRRKMLELDGYDLEDTQDKELVYKRYIAVGVPDIAELMRLAGLSGRAVTAAMQKAGLDTE
jgi:hypothetical protein